MHHEGWSPRLGLQPFLVIWRGELVTSIGRRPNNTVGLYAANTIVARSSSKTGTKGRLPEKASEIIQTRLAPFPGILRLFPEQVADALPSASVRVAVSHLRVSDALP